MPFYEYECEKCGEIFELMQKIGDNSRVKCIKCGGWTNRIFSAVPFIFGGTRWVGERGAKKEIAPQDQPKDSKKKSEKPKRKK
jgi:putative FmdB family regulatory protein